MKRTILSILAELAMIRTVMGNSAPVNVRRLRGHQRHSDSPQRRSLQISPPEYTDEIELSDSVTLRYRLDVLNDTNTEEGPNAISVQMVYKGLGWIGFAIAGEGGGMVGSEAVIGRPVDADEESVPSANPGKYSLLGQSVSEVTLMDETQQTLIDASIEQNETLFETALTFTKLMDEPGELAISAIEPNVFLWAVGSENELSYHGNNRGSFSLNFGADANGQTRESVAIGSESSNQDEDSSKISKSRSSQDSDSDSGSSGSSTSKSSDSSSSSNDSSVSKSNDSKYSGSRTSSSSYDSSSDGSDDKYWKSKNHHNTKKHQNYRSSDDKYKSSDSDSYSSDKHKSSYDTRESSDSDSDSHSNSNSYSKKSYSSDSKSHDKHYSKNRGDYSSNYQRSEKWH